MRWPSCSYHAAPVGLAGRRNGDLPGGWRLGKRPRAWRRLVRVVCVCACACVCVIARVCVPVWLTVCDSR